MRNKFVTFITLFTFVSVTLFSPFPLPSSKVSAQSTGSLRLVTNTASSFSFKKDLMLGDTDPDVKELQKILNSSADTVISTSGVGSVGQESTYFGALTKAAVIKFQEKYKSEILTPSGLNSGNGNVGFNTRKKLNTILGVNETLPSVGLPQSRTGSNIASVPATYVAPAIVVSSPSQPNMSICSFVDLLINIGVIGSNKSDLARSAMGCSTDSPSVVVKADGSKGPISVLPDTQFRLSWHSENTKSCSDGLTVLPISGSVRLVADKSLSYPISCIGINGNSVSDSVTVIVSDGENASSSIDVLSSDIVPGYNFAVFKAVTNIPTKMVIAYTDQPTATSSVKVYESDMSTSHSEKITNLLPSTLYYARVAFVVDNENNLMSGDLTFTTSDDFYTGELTQRVLSSSGGSGVVSIPGSESLKIESKVTLEAWVKPTSWSTTVGMSNTVDSVIISKGNIGGNIDYVLSLDNGKLVYSNNDASIWTNFPVVPLNEWTHVAVTVDESASKISMYVNGVKQSSVSGGPRGVFSALPQINKSNAITEYVATTSQNTYSFTTSSDWDSTSGNNNSSGDSWSSSDINSSPSAETVQSLLPDNYLSSQITSNVYLGNFYPKECNATSTEGNGFIGLIDDVKIWNVARTDSQIKADSSTSTTPTTASSTDHFGLTVQENGLIGHWSFDDGRATDLTNFMNNGAIKGDMEIVDDETAPSPIAGSEFALNGLEFSFPEACDAGLNPDDNTLSGYRVNFKGGVKSVTPSGQSYIIELETCDDPFEDLVKSVEVIGNAPARDADYYNKMGTISVIISGGLGMKIPAERDTIKGTSLDYISGPGLVSANSSLSNTSANSVGYAEDWQPQPKSCMKPEDSGMFAGGGLDWGAIVAVLAVAACATGVGCVFTAWYGVITVATIGYVAGSGVQAVVEGF